MVIIPTINITEDSLKEIEEMERVESLTGNKGIVKAQLEERDTLFFNIDVIDDSFDYKGKISIISSGMEWVTNWSRRDILDAMVKSEHITYKSDEIPHPMD